MSTQNLLNWLKKSIGEAEAGTALPTDQTLAREWQLSERTVQRLMKTLAQKNLVVRIRGKGTFTPYEISDSKVLPVLKKVSSAQTLASQIQKMIQAGLLKLSDQLPQIKYQCMHYGLSSHTVTNAYKLLEQHAFAHRIGRTWFVGPGLSPDVSGRQQKTVFMTVPDSVAFAQPFSSGNMAKALQKMELELLNFGYRLQMLRLTDFINSCETLAKKNSLPHGIFFYSFPAENLSTFDQTYLPLRAATGQHCSLVIDLCSYKKNFESSFTIEFLEHGNLNTSRARSIAEFTVISTYETKALLIDADIIDQKSSEPWGKIQGLQKIMGELVSLNPNQNLIQVIVGKLNPVVQKKIENWFTDNSSGYGLYLKEKYGETTSKIFQRKPVFLPDVNKDILSSMGTRPLMLCSSARLAVSLFDNLLESGIKAGKNFGIISLENHADLINRQISCCAIDYDLIGYLLAHALIGDIPLKHTRNGYIRVHIPVINRGLA